MDPRQRRIALNETRFREINESLRHSLESAGQAGHVVSFVCECGHASCREVVDAVVAEYEAIRANPRRFLVVAGHEMPDAEDVVERRDGFHVVEKRGDGAIVAESRSDAD